MTYYTIEGKRFLAVLYIAGMLAGTFFLNITIKTNLFKMSDFLDFTEYIKMLQNMDLSMFASYVFIVRIRQLVLFFLCLFLFSPYVVFCILDFLVSVFAGILVSAMTLKYGPGGVVRGLFFLFPQYIFYGALFTIIYVYLFRNAFVGSFYAKKFFVGARYTLLKHRILISLLILFLFLLGCGAEIFINPVILRKVFV